MEKYSMKITMTLTKDGAKQPMSTTEQTYSNMEYDDVVQTEKALLGALVSLGEAASLLKKKC